MECEICGSRIIGRPHAVSIEGAVMSVCEACSDLGYPVKEPGENLEVARGLPEPSEIVGGYPRLIRQARERLGLTQEELAKRLSERTSIVRKLEAGRLRPDEKLVEKIRKALKIDLHE